MAEVSKVRDHTRLVTLIIIFLLFLAFHTKPALALENLSDIALAEFRQIVKNGFCTGNVTL